MQELWQQHSETIITIAIILAATVVVAFGINRLFRRAIALRQREPHGDTTTFQFLGNISTALIVLIGIMIAVYSIPSLKAAAGTILAGAGVLAVAVGFASQAALSNIISGIFVVVFKPFRINDRVKFRELEGIVEDITLRHTVIRNFENRRIIVPNSIISDEVIVNSDYGEDRVCRFLDFGISYDSDIALAKQILQEEAERHPNCIDIRTPEQLEQGVPKVGVRVIGLGDSSVNLRGFAWAENSANAFAMGCDLFETVKARYEAAGIEIPFPHRTLVMKEGQPVPIEVTQMAGKN